MFHTISRPLVLSILLLLCTSGCGSSSNSPSSDLTSNTNPLLDTNEGNGAELSQTNGETDSTAEAIVPNNSDDSSIDNSSNDNTDPPAQTTDSNSQSNTVTAIAAVGQPVNGMENSVLFSLDAWDATTELDQIAIAGTVGEPDAFASQRQSAVWLGPTDNLQLLAIAGASIERLPDNTRFGEYQGALQLASDGSVGMLIRFTGASDDGAFAVSNNGALEIVLRDGDTLPVFDGNQAIGTVNALTYSSFGAVISAIPEPSEFRFGGVPTLWLWNREQFIPLVELGRENYHSSNGPTLPNSSCHVYVSQNNNTRGGIYLTDSGDVVFLSGLRSNPNATPCRQEAIVRYRNGTFSSIVGDGDLVPGTPASLFSDIRLNNVKKDGTIIMSATIETPTGTAFFDRKWSYWAFPPDGEPKLLALQGEEISSGTETLTLPEYSQDFDLTANNSLDVGSRITLNNRPGMTERFVILGGTGHSGQPHSAIAAPGASSLTIRASTSGIPPEGYPSTAFFSRIGFPSVGPTGILRFWAELSDSVSGDKVTTAIWLADGNNNVYPVVEVGDTVLLSNDMESEIFGLSSNSQSRSDVDDPIVTMNSGDLVIEAWYGSRIRTQSVLLRVNTD